MSPFTHLFIGIDLGQKQDPTALALVAREEAATGEIDAATREAITEVTYSVRGLRRLPLGMPYTAQVAEIRDLIGRLPGERRPTIVVDATGVGAPVVELVREATGKLAQVVPVVFTSGDSARFENGSWRVPKKDLVHSVVVLLQQGTLKISAKSPHAPLLVDELTNMRMRISAGGNAGYAAWREGEHDDLVFALALACWRARRTRRGTLGDPRPILWG